MHVYQFLRNLGCLSLRTIDSFSFALRQEYSREIGLGVPGEERQVFSEGVVVYGKVSNFHKDVILWYCRYWKNSKLGVCWYFRRKTQLGKKIM